MVELINLIPANEPWLYILIVLFGMFFIQVFYNLYYYNKLGSHFKKNKQNVTPSYPPVSIIICARNESENLQAYLPRVLQQEYPGNYEVIVVNDASEDESELVLARMKDQYKNLYYTNIPYDKKFRHGKKLAVTLGIKAAKYEHLLFTDADCEPAGLFWLKTMAAGFAQGKDIVLGYGPYKKQKGFVNFWQRYDTFHIAIQYMSFALRGAPYMGVGRNMAYKKSLFEKNQGFKKHQHILSGDDDLFIRDVATKTNVAIVAFPDGFTLSNPSNSIKEWKHQKSRHLSTSSFYRFKIKVLIGLEVMSRQLFWGISIISFFFSTFVLAIIVLIICKLAIQILIQRRVAKQFNQTDLLLGSVLLDFVLPLVTGILLFGAKRQAKKTKWT